MSKLNSILAQYAESHQNPTNQKLHKICVPLIEFSLLGILSCLPVFAFMGAVTWAHVLVVFAIIYYAQFKNWKVIVGSLVMAFIYLLVIEKMKPYVLIPCIVIFVIAWIGQFVGHKIEGKKPSFLDDLFFLLIGPLWVLKSFLSPLGIDIGDTNNEK